MQENRVDQNRATITDVNILWFELFLILYKQSHHGERETTGKEF